MSILLSRFVKPHFHAGAIEVHAIYDAPGSPSESPKEIERQRCDGSAKDKVGPHHCTDFSSDLLVSEKWRMCLVAETVRPV